jgi:serine/threonine protein kinase/tetratricopeptide (TPR) repeat protein
VTVDFAKLQEIFLAAVERHLPEDWDAYVNQACADDDELRRQVNLLLQAHREAGSVPGAAASEPDQTRADQTATEAPGALIGPYKLMEQIGEGGMGLVFVAEQQEPIRRKVALKLIKPGMDTRQVIARFEAERQALAIMDHANIAKVLDGGATVSGRPYFVMDLVKGLPITEFCDQGQLTARERLELFASVCQAVQHAHQKGIIHRDIKPSNVLVTVQDGAPLVKVIDFGIAKALGQQLTDKTVFTGFAQMIGTPLYMSPEQAALSNADVDTRSDIYSLGVLLYEVLTGTTPFGKERFKEVGYDEMRRIIREEEPPRPSTRISTLGKAATTVSTQRKSDPKRLSQLLHGELDWIVMKALEKDRNRRYETVSAFAADVQRYLADEPVLACPPSAIYRLRKFLRRKRSPVLAVAVVLLALVGGIVGLMIGLLQAEAAWQAEANQRGIAEVNAGKAHAAVDAEKAARLTAENRLKQIEKANNILASIFQNLDPRQAEKEQGLRRDLGRLVDDAAKLLHAEAIDNPLVVARLQYLLGTSQVNMGHYQRGIPLLRESWQTRHTHLGPDHLDTLTSLHGLAWAYLRVGQTDKAVPLFERTLAKRQASLGPDHAQTLVSLNDLALAYQDCGLIDKALPMLKQVFEKEKALLGPDDPKTLTAMSNLAFAYSADGRQNIAVELMEQALEQQMAARGPDHADTIAFMNNLGQAYQSVGRLNRALPLLEQAFEKAKTVLGPEHPDTLTSQHNLARAYKGAGRLDKAVPLFEETVAKLKKQLGPDHPDTLESMLGLAKAYHAAKQPDKAMQLFLQTLQESETKHGSAHPATLNCKQGLADAYKAAGRLDKALPLYEQVLAGRRVKLGRKHPDTLKSLDQLAYAYAKLKQFDRALLLHKESVQLTQERFGLDHPETRMGLANLGANYMDLGQLDKASMVLEDVYAWARRQPADVQGRFAWLADALADTYERAGQLHKAEPFERENLKRARKLFGADDPRTTPTIAALSHNLLRQRKYVEAEKLMRECLALSEAKQAEHWTTFQAKALLGKALLGQTKYAEAEPLLLQGYEGMKQREDTMSAQVRVRCLTNAVQYLVELYDAWDMSDKAALWRKKLEEMNRPKQSK